MISRRRIIVAFGAGALAPLASFAQQTSAKVFRIGFLGPEGEARYARLGNLEALRAGLREFGYVEGKNIVMELRFADSKYERLAGLAAELIERKVDVIVTHGAEGPVAASRATSTIPIVFATAGDLVALGLVQNLARPGGNMTGSLFFNQELMAKRLELAKEVMPRITQVAVLVVRGSPATAGFLLTMGVAAKSLKLELQTFEVGGPADFDGAFSAMAKKRVNAVVIPEHPFLITNAQEISKLATGRRIISIGYNESFAAAGGTIGYGVDFAEPFRRVGYFVNKIFTGTKPGDIPIEQAKKFDLVVNMKTARALGIKIPQSILVRADKVIE